MRLWFLHLEQLVQKHPQCLQRLHFRWTLQPWLKHVTTLHLGRDLTAVETRKGADETIKLFDSLVLLMLG
jgi:hypothetical protein